MPIVIKFDFTLDALSGITVPLEAQAERKDPLPCYSISKIVVAGRSDNVPALPDLNIQCIIKEGKNQWVHTDSKRTSELSRLIGQAIEQSQAVIAVAEETGDEEE